MAEEKGKWITVNGTHVFIEDGQTVEEALDNIKSKATDKRKKALEKGFTQSEIANFTDEQLAILLEMSDDVPKSKPKAKKTETKEEKENDIEIANRVVNIKDTSFQYYNDFLNEEDAKYHEETEGKVGKIEYITPDEYVEMCAEFGFNEETTYNDLVRKTLSDTSSIQYHNKLFESGEKFNLPYIDKAKNSQEGLHRALVLKNYGIKKIPVLIVDYKDEEAKKFGNAQKVLDKYSYSIDKITNYRSEKKQKVIDNLEWYLEEVKEDKGKVEFDVQSLKNDKAKLKIDGIEYTIEVKEDYGEGYGVYITLE